MNDSMAGSISGDKRACGLTFGACTGQDVSQLHLRRASTKPLFVWMVIPS